MIPCPDKHLPGITCATCDDLGRYEPGHCICGVNVQREPVGLRSGKSVWRYCYPGSDWVGFQPWVERCRRCDREIAETWMPTTYTAWVG